MSPAAPIHYQYDPVQTTKTSVHGAINMLGLAKRVKAKILQASTSEVYGDPKVHPQREDYWVNVGEREPGRQTRAFCYVDDLIEALLRIMATPAEFTKPVNIGNPGEFAFLDLAQKVIALTGSNSKIAPGFRMATPGKNANV